MAIERLVAGLLHASVLGAWVAWVAWSAPDGRTRLRRLLAVFAAVVAFAAIVTLVPLSAIGPERITPVREGGTEMQIHIARGEGGDVGSLFAHDYLGVLAADPPSIEAVARVELAATVAASIGLTAIGAELLGSWWISGLFVLAFCASPVVQNAALGSGSGPIAWLWMIVGGTALAGMRAASKRRDAWIAAALAVGSAILLLWTRVELCVLPVLGVCVVAADRAGWLAHVAASFRSHRVVVAVAAVVTLAISAAIYFPVAHAASSSDRWGWLIQALFPLDPSPLTLPRILVSMWPLGIAVLAMVGMFRAPATNLGVGLATLFLLRVYHAAGHGSMTGHGIWAQPLEMLRYMALLAPAVLALSWWGWLLLPRPVRAIGALLLLVPAIPSAWTMRYRDEDRGPMWTWRGVVDVDSRREVRLLASTMHETGCGFVAPIAPLDGDRADWMAWRSSWPDLHGSDLRIVKLSDVTRAEAIAAIPGAPSCVRLYAGLDCNRPGGDGCADLVTGLHKLHTEAFPAMPHAHPSHGWETVPHVELSVWDVSD